MKLRVAFPLVLLLIVLALIAFTIPMTFKSKVFPLVVGIPLAILLGMQLVRELSPGLAKKEAVSSQAQAINLASRQYIVAIGWLAAFGVSLYLFGFLVGAPLFILIYVKRHGYNWLTTAISTILAVAIMFAFMYLIRQYGLYQGIIYELLAD